VKVVGDPYPTPPLQSFLGSAASALSWGLLILSLGGEWLLGNLPFRVPPELLPYLQNKWYVLGAYFVLSQASSYLTSSGAYEILVNGELLHSKLQTGTVPTTEVLLTMIRGALAPPEDTFQSEVF
jgi:selT/selW/selH-like putative selenoprotein